MSKNISLTLDDNKSLHQLTTLQNAARANQCLVLNDSNQLALLSDVIRKHNDFIVIGQGSNVLFVDNYDGLVIVNRLSGVQILNEDENNLRVHIAAGEIWHDIVLYLTEYGAHGLENLALIPGTVGAAPVQNIGAYGVEIANFIESVSVFDLVSQKSTQLACSECGFNYRNSNFKQKTWKQKYIITGVTLSLSKHFSPILSYDGLTQPFPPASGIELLERVVTIRQSKLPNPNQLANAGSFFKNPVIARSQLAKIRSNYPDAPYFDIDDDYVKIPAAWFIENTGFKGLRRSNDSGVYENHALILVNHGNAHGRDIYELACDIINTIAEKFNVVITPEVNILGINSMEKV